MTAKCCQLTHGSNTCRNVLGKSPRRITTSPANGTTTITAIIIYADTLLQILRKGGNKQGLLLRHSGITLEDLAGLRQLHLNNTKFFLAISLLATSEYNHNQNIIHTWTYNGRFRKEHKNIVGFMFQDLPVKLEQDVFASVRRQTKECIIHKNYPYTSLDEHFLEDDKLCFMYNGRLYFDGPLIDISDGLIEMQHSYAGSQNILDVEVL